MAFLSLATLVALGLLVPWAARRLGFRLFDYVPSVVWVYLLVLLLCAGTGLTKAEGFEPLRNGALRALLPFMLLLVMSRCELLPLWRLGGRTLGTFFLTTLSFAVAFGLAAWLYTPTLPEQSWKALGALSAGWIGGTANLLAVKEAVAMPDHLLGAILVTDALTYAVWLAALLAMTPLAAGFNRWAGTRGIVAQAPEAALESASDARVSYPRLLGYLLVALGLTALSLWLAGLLPTSPWLSRNTLAILLATVIALGVAQLPWPGKTEVMQLGQKLLYVLVALMASQADFSGVGSIPLFILAGFTVLLGHIAFMILMAKLFRLDLFSLGVCSLAHIGGVASAPILAASYAPQWVPAGVLLGLLGYIVGTPGGLLIARLLEWVSA